MAGANMVTYSTPSLCEALRRVAAQSGRGGDVTCSWCGMSGLSETDFWAHQPLYHIYEKQIPGCCPVCDEVGRRRHVGGCCPVCDEVGRRRACGGLLLGV